MIIAGEEEKLLPLTGLATGMELSQLLIVFWVLVLAVALQAALKLKPAYFTMPVLIKTFA
jgi:hypothetical protein